jgi:hypothetical protein
MASSTNYIRYSYSSTISSINYRNKRYNEIVSSIVIIFILDLQTINITLRILYRPKAEILPKIFSTLGLDYEERVLPSITNEVLKSVVVSLNSFSPEIYFANNLGSI